MVVPLTLAGCIAAAIGDNTAVLLWHIGDVIRKLREDRGLSRKELAALAQMRPNTLGDLEANRSNFERDTLTKVASALEITPERISEQVPHDPEACRVSYSVRLPDDDESKRLASLWRGLALGDRQLVITLALAVLRSRGDDGKGHGDADTDREPPEHPE